MKNEEIELIINSINFVAFSRCLRLVLLLPKKPRSAHTELKDVTLTDPFQGTIIKSKMKRLDNTICIVTHVKTIKPKVHLSATNDPDTLNQAQEQIRQGN